MKNVFKFLGIALLASSLVFASCGKDEETETPGTENNGGNNNGGNNNGGNNGGNTNAGVTIAMGSVASYTTPQDSLVAFTGNGKATIVASKRSAKWTGADSYSMYFPFTRIELPAVVGQYDTASANLLYYTADFYRIYQQDPQTYAAFEEMPDWLLRGNMSANVTAFNSTNLTITATASGVMYNQYQGYMDYSAAVQAGTVQQGAEALAQFMADAPEATMTATVTSVTLRNMEGKGIAKGKVRM